MIIHCHQLAYQSSRACLQLSAATTVFLRVHIFIVHRLTVRRHGVQHLCSRLVHFLAPQQNCTIFHGIHLQSLLHPKVLRHGYHGYPRGLH